MSIYQSGSGLTYRGSHGGMTYTKWKGKNVVKAKTTLKGYIPTLAQLTNRVIFAAISQFYTAGKGILYKYQKQNAIGVTESNVFITNNKAIYSAVDGVLTTRNPQLIMICKGEKFQDVISPSWSMAAAGFQEKQVEIVPNQNQTLTNYEFKLIKVSLIEFWTNESNATVSVDNKIVLEISDEDLAAGIHYLIVAYNTITKRYTESYYVSN